MLLWQHSAPAFLFYLDIIEYLKKESDRESFKQTSLLTPWQSTWYRPFEESRLSGGAGARFCNLQLYVPIMGCGRSPLLQDEKTGMLEYSRRVHDCW